MGEPTNATDAVLEWYERLPARQVDLVGDYAGNELFLIDGDSLLLQCLDNGDIDFDNGFQLLHAVHSVEAFLCGLITRKCNFHVAFFDSHETLCVPPHVSPKHHFKFKLARAVIIRHLSVNVPRTWPQVQIEVYSSIKSPDFLQYFATSGLYFLMCHDGATPLAHSKASGNKNFHHVKADTESKSNGADTQNGGSDQGTMQSSAAPRAAALVNSHRKITFRSAIYWFIKRGHNVALINGLKFRDTKVMTMVLEGSRRANKGLEELLLGLTLNGTTQGDALEEITIASPSFFSQLDQSIVSESQIVVICVLRHMLFKDPLQADIARALIHHTALLAHTPIVNRRVEACASTDRSERFLKDFSTAACSLFRTSEWAGFMRQRSIDCDIADLVDGRIYNKVFHRLQINTGHMQINAKIQAEVNTIINAIASDGGHQLTFENAPMPKSAPEALLSNGIHPSTVEVGTQDLLPFSNPIFDRHLASIQISIDNSAKDRAGNTSARIFNELSHWHNEKPLLQKRVTDERSEWQKKRAMKLNQRFLAEMLAYAASLTSAVGKSLDPEVIIVSKDIRTDTKKDKKNANEEKPSNGKPVAANKSAVKTSKAAAIVASNKAAKADSQEDKGSRLWQNQLTILRAENPENKFVKARGFLIGLNAEQRNILGSEIQLYLLSTLLEIWIRSCRNDDIYRPWGIAALMWDIVNQLNKAEATIPKAVVEKLDVTCKSLGLPRPTLRPQSSTSDRKLSFPYALSGPVDRSLEISNHPKDFQLNYCGPYFDRSIDSAPDDRVRFDPDGWQREVLDMIDSNKSIFVVAPTSAGKTFISFYAMRQVLKASDDGVLVYVAPTKALVNQIAAELQANFKKNFEYGGKSVWAIHTRDYRVNNPTGCQVLVTVPHILQIMLLSPENAKSWAPRVKRIIFDEIHSIGQAEDGRVWEQLLLFAPCPIIALSATVGNPGEFNDWLVSTQKSHNVDLKMIQHPYRYSDLRKFVYYPPEKFLFGGLKNHDLFGVLGLDGAPGFEFMHPVASLINESRGIPEDLHLEPRDCLTLWKCMKKYETSQYPVESSLDPSTALPDTILKVEVIKWEKSLKQVLKIWMADKQSPFGLVLDELSKPLYSHTHADSRATKSTARDLENAQPIDARDLKDTTLPLVYELHAQGALPAILFNYDRTMCEKICQKLMEQLKSSEAQWKESSDRWKNKISDWEQYKKDQERKKPKKVTAKPKKKGAEDGDDEKLSKADTERDNADAGSDPLASFDPEAPVDSLQFGISFHFANNKALLPSELAEHMRRLRWRHIADWLCEALTRGIAVHHAGMNRTYRQVVETLFRKGFLRVVIATGTLALGINMPCKTVVFSGDSVFLTALNFRQASGRAGRRGFDLLGNVVFQNIPMEKACRLVSSKLPDLNGHFPITTTLILRLFILLHGSKDDSKGSKYAEKVINTLLSQSRLFLGGASFRDQVLHHVRFSVEYLRRQFLLDIDGAPINFAGCVSHLYFTENSSFALHTLLKDGYFHNLCAELNTKSEERILDTLMLVMAHLFGRHPCRQADQEFIDKVAKPSSSIVFLPPLPPQAESILRDHNEQTLQIFSTYAKTFAAQHLKEDDRKMPLTGMLMGGESTKGDTFLDSLPPTTVRSAFSALSGHGDDFRSVTELCRTARDGVFLEESVIPHIPLYPDEADTPLNAYLYDFYRHGDVAVLEKANGVRRGDVWFLLNDFSLVLATIVTSFRNYMNLNEGTDLDMLDVMGGGDAHEGALDERLAERLEQMNASSSGTSTPAEAVKEQPKPVTKAKTKVTDSWEDDVPEADAETEDPVKDKAALTAGDAVIDAEKDVKRPAWEESSGQDLMKVLRAFERLKVTFDEKFKKMWA